MLRSARLRSARPAVLAAVGVLVLNLIGGCASTRAQAYFRPPQSLAPSGVGGYPSGSASPTVAASASAPASASPAARASSAAPSKPPAPPAAPPPRTGKPGPGNTGVIPGTALTVVNNDVTFATNGAVIAGQDFHGIVTVTGSNITFRNCVFRGRAISSNAALLDAERGTNTVVEDSEFVPSHPSATVDDIWANRTSIYRANIHGGVDGVKTGSDVVVQDSYIHDMSWFASDPNQGGGETHNDGVQGFYGDTRVTLRHNNIDMSTTKDANAALQDSASETHVDGNWLDGGGCMLNFSHQENQPLTGLYVTNNRFGRHSAYQCPILLSTKAVLSQNSGNVWDDTGKPIPPVQQHD
jgi:hypothetical protein